MSRTKLILLWIMAAFYFFNGVSHFANFERYLPIMPDYLPWHGPLVVITGLAEIALGIAVLIPTARRVAAWGLVGLLIFVFPANVNVAVNDLPFLTDEPLTTLNWARLPLQAVFILWAWWYTKSDRPSAPQISTWKRPDATRRV